jgi:hypothetical protein
MASRNGTAWCIADKHRARLFRSPSSEGGRFSSSNFITANV